MAITRYSVKSATSRVYLDRSRVSTLQKHLKDSVEDESSKVSENNQTPETLGDSIFGEKTGQPTKC